MRSKTKVTKWFQMPKVKRGVVGIIRDKEGRFLSMFHWYRGAVGFPSGEVQDYEKAFDALTRELKEELGITVKKAEYLGTVKKQEDDTLYVNTVYLITEYEGEPKRKEPYLHGSPGYLSQDDLEKLGVTPITEDALNLLKKYEGTEKDK